LSGRRRAVRSSRFGDSDCTTDLGLWAQRYAGNPCRRPTT